MSDTDEIDETTYLHQPEYKSRIERRENEHEYESVSNSRRSIIKTDMTTEGYGRSSFNEASNFSYTVDQLLEFSGSFGK